jgi:predicted metal-dependent peptidase
MEDIQVKIEQKTYNERQILDEVAAITIDWLVTGAQSTGEPFYAHFFTGLVKKVTTRVDTLAVAFHGGLVTLYINPYFWTEILNTPLYKTGVLKHEILHIVFKHIFRGKDYKHKFIFNIAADLVVNQCIAPVQLPEGAILLETFPELELPPQEHASIYYDALMKLKDQYENCPDSEEACQNKSWQNLKSMLDQENENQKRHIFWDDIEKLSSAEREILEANIRQNLENTLQRTKITDYGNLPGVLRDYLDEFKNSLTPVMNWKRVLRLFANSSSRTRIKNTIRRPSKRYGSTPGIQVKRKQKVLVAIDTSGSISLDDLKAFFGEIYHIWRQGAEICVVECDTVIQQIYFYTGHPPEVVMGGGGTAFDAPIQYANKEYRPDALIYFTDAYGASPIDFPTCPMLWLVSTTGDDVDNIKDFPGRKVKMM